MTTATLPIRPAPAVTRNGLPGWKPYVYRGTGEDTLTGHLDFDVELATVPNGSRFDLKPCGTEAAYRRHKKHGEYVDDACREAANRRAAEYKARTRQRRAS